MCRVDAARLQNLTQEWNYKVLLFIQNVSKLLMLYQFIYQALPGSYMINTMLLTGRPTCMTVFEPETHQKYSNTVRIPILGIDARRNDCKNMYLFTRRAE